jgi:serine/threonine protein kinase
LPSLFISYRRSDSPDTVKLIHERLKQRLPRWEIFYDHQSVPLGEQFPERLRENVSSATVVLVIIGPKWLAILQERKGSAIDHVRTEVRLALEAGTNVVPILAGHAAMPMEADLADFADLQPLLARNGRRVRPDPDFEGDLEPIIAYLKQLDSDEAIGATLADKYTLTAEIGQGGMGIVYRAEQKQPVKRTVAVKLIKPGMDSRDVLARFDAERQALAVMDHPNIAKVHDAGRTAGGRPFFVMEFVKGVPITQYCDEKKLTPQERLLLFIDVCNAVQHAHQKGIIHRDIKPSNVLVTLADGKPIPKVIDFGLAKALGQKLTEKTLYTALDTRVGTLEYSAPEQAAGRSFDVDTRSDIYSLGVLLYELLTGAPPFTHAELLKIGEEEMRRLIREDEPARPSKKLSSSGELPLIAANRHLEPNKLTRLVQGELDWIAMKCLEKEQARRYETANQLAQDLQRFLADEPVQAGPPSATYRMKKFLRRNRGPVIAAGLVFLALLAGIIGTSIGLVSAERAREAEARQGQLTAAALAESEENRKLAEKRFDEKRGALDEMLQSFSDDRLKLLPGSQQIREVFFEKGLEQYAQILRERQDDPAIRARLADSYRELGTLRAEVGAPAEALAALQKAVALRRQTTAAAPVDAAAPTALAHALFQLGQFYFEQRQMKDAVAPVQESVDIFTRLLAQNPGEPAYKAGLGRGLTRLASVKPDLDQEKTLGRARELLQEAAAALPDNADVLTDLARVLNNLAADLPPARQSAAEGLELFDQARKSADRALALNPAHSQAHLIRLRAVRNRSANLAKPGRETERLRLLEEALSDTKAFVRKNPAVVSGALSQVELQDQLAGLYWETSSRDQAITTWEETTRVCEGLCQRDPTNANYPAYRINALVVLSRAETQRNHYPTAASYLERALTDADELMRVHPKAAQLFTSLILAFEQRGRLAWDAERPREALGFFSRGIEFFGKYGALPDADIERATGNYIKCVRGATENLVKLGEPASAIQTAERALPLGAKLNDPDSSSQWLDLMTRLAGLCEASGKTDNAITALRRLADEATRLLKKSPHWFEARRYLIDGLYSLVNLHRQNGHLKEEVQVARELLEQQGYLRGKDYTKVIAATENPTEASVRTLREVLDAEPRMRLYRINEDFNSETRQTGIYLTESLRSFDDQVRWLKERGGKPYEDEVKGIRSIYEKAQQTGVSGLDAATDALNILAAEQAEWSGPLREQIAKLKTELAAAPEKPLARRRLAQAYVILARRYLGNQMYQAANTAVEDAFRYIERDAVGMPRNDEDGDSLASSLYVQGSVQCASGKLEQGYNTLLEARRCVRPGTQDPEFRNGDLEYALGEASAKLGHGAESVQWFLAALPFDHSDAAGQIGQRFLEEPRNVAAVVPESIRQLLFQLHKENQDPKEFLGHFRRALADRRQTEIKQADVAELQMRNERIAQLEGLAGQYQDLAATYRGLQRLDKYYQALESEYTTRGAQLKLNPKSDMLRNSQAKVAVEIANAHLEAKETDLALKWLTDAAGLDHIESLFQLAGWYSKGIHVKADPLKGDHYRYLASLTRGKRAFEQNRFDEALHDLKVANDAKEAREEDETLLWQCFSQLRCWDDAIVTYQRAFEREATTSKGPRALVRLLLAYIVSAHSDEVIKFSARLRQKQWQPRADNEDQLNQYQATIDALRIIAAQALGQNAAEDEKSLREHRKKTRFSDTRWIREIQGAIDSWLDQAKLAPERQISVRLTLRMLAGEDPKRAIALMYWKLDTGEPFWVFVAVRSEQYKNFHKAYQSNNVNLHFFAPYGEIIVSGHGKSPPDEVVRKVAEMYQTTPEKLMSSLKDQPPPDSQPAQMKKK